MSKLTGIEVARIFEAMPTNFSTLDFAKAIETAVLSRATPDGWISIQDRLPADETPVLILLNGEVNIGELRWNFPGPEDMHRAFQYWDSPNNDGQNWEWSDITRWMNVPAAPSPQETL